MGCGSGRWAQFVAPRVKQLICIDPSEAINVAKKNLDKFDKEKKYIIVCRSGGRSSKVTDFLVENEIDALNLTGGMKKFSQVSTNVKDSLGNKGQII